MSEETEAFKLLPIGFVRSELRSRDLAPKQNYEGGVEAWIDIDIKYSDALDGIVVGQELVLITWFHQSDREILKVHPRGDKKNPLTGVFATRSPARPNPIGLHRVKVVQIDGTRIKIYPLEAIDGTPIIDLKPVLDQSNDF